MGCQIRWSIVLISRPAKDSGVLLRLDRTPACSTAGQEGAHAVRILHDAGPPPRREPHAVLRPRPRPHRVRREPRLRRVLDRRAPLRGLGADPGAGPLHRRRRPTDQADPPGHRRGEPALSPPVRCRRAHRLPRPPHPRPAGLRRRPRRAAHRLRPVRARQQRPAADDGRVSRDHHEAVHRRRARHLRGQVLDDQRAAADGEAVPEAAHPPRHHQPGRRPRGGPGGQVWRSAVDRDVSQADRRKGPGRAMDGPGAAGRRARPDRPPRRLARRLLRLPGGHAEASPGRHRGARDQGAAGVLHAPHGEDVGAVLRPRREARHSEIGR